MSSESRIQANRLNALKSTGPTSQEGKKRSSLNACKHGFYAQFSLLPGESEEELAEFSEELIASLAPCDAVQMILCRKVVHISWMLKRLPALYERVVEDSGKRERSKQIRGSGVLISTPDPLIRGIDAIAACFRVPDSENAYVRLEKHECRMLCQLSSLIRQLKQLKKDSPASLTHEAFMERADQHIERNEANARVLEEKTRASSKPVEPPVKKPEVWLSWCGEPLFDEHGALRTDLPKPPCRTKEEMAEEHAAYMKWKALRERPESAGANPSVETKPTGTTVTAETKPTAPVPAKRTRFGKY